MCDSCAPPPGTSDQAPATPRSDDQAQILHRRITHAVLIQRQAMRAIALGFAAMRKDKLHRDLGFAGLVEYGEQCFGFSPSKTRQLALVGRRLPDLPLLDQALATGALGWTKLRTLCHIATPETEQAWVERAQQVTSRELEDLVADARPGAPPPDPDKEYEPPRLVWAKFGLDPFHFERMMKAFAGVRHSLGGAHLSASQLLLHIVEHWLDSEHGAGEAETEVAAVAATGEADSAAHVCCADEAPDSAHVCHSEQTSSSAHVCCEPEPNRPNSPRRGENADPIHYRIVEHRCPSCEAAWTEGRAGRIELHSQVRAMIECDAEVVAGDASAGTPGHMVRTIPPATRRAVLIRDQGRCQVPGCGHQHHLELHHTLPRAEQGGHQSANLVVLCWTHHEMLHRGIIGVQRGSDGQLAWTRSGGDPLGMMVSIHREHAELEHMHLEDFEGPVGSWPCIRGYWGALDPPADWLAPRPEDPAGDKPRPPRGRASFVLGDQERPAPDWMRMGVRV